MIQKTLDGGMSKATVFRTLSVKRNTHIDALKRAKEFSDLFYSFVV